MILLRAVMNMVQRDCQIETEASEQEDCCSVTVR